MAVALVLTIVWLWSLDSGRGVRSWTAAAGPGTTGDLGLYRVDPEGPPPA
jgi:hypothetical protein